jgi:hypothetical protein
VTTFLAVCGALVTTAGAIWALPKLWCALLAVARFVTNFNAAAPTLLRINELLQEIRKILAEYGRRFDQQDIEIDSIKKMAQDLARQSPNQIRISQ